MERAKNLAPYLSYDGWFAAVLSAPLHHFKIVEKLIVKKYKYLKMDAWEMFANPLGDGCGLHYPQSRNNLK